jgi:hypothetical protein
MDDEKPIEFASADERGAWDAYAAGFASRAPSMQDTEMIAQAADELLRLRRTRDERLRARLEAWIKSHQ